MFYCIAYDISNDRQRRKVHIWCKQTGLRRIQKSLFLGTSTDRLITEFEQKVRALIPSTDILSILTLDKATYRQITHIGNGSSVPVALATDISTAISQGKKFTIQIF